MFRSLLTPRWLLLHALFIVATVATGFLAVWQWDRAHEAGGSFQNLGYALQWPLFGVFTIFLWIRLMRMEAHRDRDEAEPEAPGTAPQDEADLQVVEEAPSAARRKRPLVPPPAPPVGAEDDPELAAYNQYLADLNESDRRAS
ncbi:hypothetical protein AB0I53_10050 [Saccharopolyspora sp. NPDC050389]|uniref:hypothetical protein n=1 Tax=Saccharopolyspora sp. NPDC050389 TaxID=3155516 RepID=UPI0033E8AB42